MTRHIGPLLLLVLTSGVLAAPALASGDANLIFGRKCLSLDDVEMEGISGVESQANLGVAVTLDFDWPVMLALDLFSSNDDHTLVPLVEGEPEYLTDIETTEMNVGVRRYWGDKLKPYVGGGLAYIQLESIQIESGESPGGPYWDMILDDSDSAVGFWINAGTLYRLGRYLNIGVDLRYSDAEVELLPSNLPTIKLNSGGIHYGLLFGLHW